jgi:murein DD-endopeptidase MepM/ murein hydrolase activator NlpD
MIDVDGSRRDRPHSGVDGGSLGDAILAPADGTVKAAWLANWGWGEEGALIIRHSRRDLILGAGPPFYYSEFDHLRCRDVRHFKTDQRIKRGRKIGTVDRPGGKPEYLPEVHWEVYEVTDDSAIGWKVENMERKSGRTRNRR